MRNIYKNHSKAVVWLGITLIILSYIGYISFHTKILPFQSITLNCVMDGRQKFTHRKSSDYAPVVYFPKVYKIKFGFIDGEFIEGGDFLIQNNFLKKKVFGYQRAGYSLLIQPSYMPPWKNDYEAPGQRMYFIFPLSSKNLRNTLIIEYLASPHVIGEYDAIYKCVETK